MVCTILTAQYSTARCRTGSNLTIRVSPRVPPSRCDSWLASSSRVTFMYGAAWAVCYSNPQFPQFLPQIRLPARAVVGEEWTDRQWLLSLLQPEAFVFIVYSVRSSLRLCLPSFRKGRDAGRIRPQGFVKGSEIVRRIGSQVDLTSNNRANFPVAFQNEPCHPSCRKPKGWSLHEGKTRRFARNEIGRASCRERVWR